MAAVLFRGVTWRCEGTACVGYEGDHASRADSLMRSCREVATGLGKLAAYSRKGLEMRAGALATCNSSAGR